MKRNVGGLLVSLALVGLSYNWGRWRSEANTIQADEISKWTKVETPLVISRDDKLGYVFVQGFWQLTDASKDKQPLSPVAVKIECTHYNRTCGAFQASVSEGGVLKADFFNYYIATWTKDGIVADDFDEGPCGLGHHLSLDFKSNSVTVTDYPKNASRDKNCQSYQNLHSYALHGGQIVLHPPAPWDPQANPTGKK